MISWSHKPNQITSYNYNFIGGGIYWYGSFEMYTNPITQITQEKNNLLVHACRWFMHAITCTV